MSANSRSALSSASSRPSTPEQVWRLLGSACQGRTGRHRRRLDRGGVRLTQCPHLRHHRSSLAAPVSPPLDGGRGAGVQADRPRLVAVAAHDAYRGAPVDIDRAQRKASLMHSPALQRTVIRARLRMPVREVAEHAAASAREHGPVVLASVSEGLGRRPIRSVWLRFCMEAQPYGLLSPTPRQDARKSATESRVVNPRGKPRPKNPGGRGHIWRAGTPAAPPAWTRMAARSRTRSRAGTQPAGRDPAPRR